MLSVFKSGSSLFVLLWHWYYLSTHAVLDLKSMPKGNPLRQTYATWILQNDMNSRHIVLVHISYSPTEGKPDRSWSWIKSKLTRSRRKQMQNAYMSTVSYVSHKLLWMNMFKICNIENTVKQDSTKSSIMRSTELMYGYNTILQQSSYFRRTFSASFTWC